MVGAGSAGCVVAARLSEDPATTVLLLEAGGRDRNPWLHVPAGYYFTVGRHRLDWGYRTDPEPQLGGRTLAFPRGRVLGGCSAINGLVYIRGNRNDYDTWRALGHRGWGWEDVLPYFKRAEDQARGADDYHGTGGPLAVRDLSERRPICEAFMEAAVQSGLRRNLDFNGPEQDGVGYFQVTVRRRLRCSSASAYLRPARGRPNLSVEVRALASRILFAGRRAAGIAYLKDGRERRVRARREVIVSAGTCGATWRRTCLHSS